MVQQWAADSSQHSTAHIFILFIFLTILSGWAQAHPRSTHGGATDIRCAVSISHQASEFLTMEIIYESDSIKNIFPLESTPYTNIVHVHMLVSVHLLKSRKRWHLLSFCKSDVISQKHCYIWMQRSDWIGSNAVLSTPPLTVCRGEKG